MVCNGIVDDITPLQASTRAVLQQNALRLASHMRTKFPREIAWRRLWMLWNKTVALGTVKNRAEFDVESGCLIVGIPADGGHLPTLHARVFLAMSSGASGGRVCGDLHTTLLVEATDVLGFPVSLDCDDVVEFGMIRPGAKECTGCQWGPGAPSNCHEQRKVWPELVGRPLRQVLSILKRTGKPVEISTGDSMYERPLAQDVLRVVYDAKTGLVTSPAPREGVVPPPTSDSACFIKPDAASRTGCLGSPVIPPSSWSKFVGQFLPDVVDILRMTYPHATIEPLPNNARVSPDFREDRIRVRFDAMGKVTSVPMVG
jgi:hypothetical protein